MKTLFNFIFSSKSNSTDNITTASFIPFQSLFKTTSFQLDFDNDLMQEIIEELEYRAD